MPDGAGTRPATGSRRLRRGLVKLGFTKTEGKERAREAYLRLKAQLGREPLEKEIFEAAVRRN